MIIIMEVSLLWAGFGVWPHKMGVVRVGLTLLLDFFKFFLLGGKNPVQVGDLMRSFKLLLYKSEDGVRQLEEIAMDINLNPVFLTAIEMVDDETFLGADGRHIFLCQKNRFGL